MFNKEIIESLPTPCHLFDLNKLEKNLSVLKMLKNKTNCKILYALKGCSQLSLLPYLSAHLDGVCASGLFEAYIGKQYFGREIHTFSTAYKYADILEISQISDVVIFNSLQQFYDYSHIVSNNDKICGIRVNPEYSEIKNPKINPCYPNSRFGLNSSKLKEINQKVNYLHFHSMCEQDSDVLERTFFNFINRFQKHLQYIKWLNIGGGQLYTSENYNLANAILYFNKIQKEYNLSIIIEPCEAVLLNVGYLVSSVVDIIHENIAILDLSAICHIPDIVYSNYKYEIIDTEKPANDCNKYTLAGPTCYAGDLFGEYSFSSPLQKGDKIIFKDTAHYTAVKSSMFNGIPLPGISFIKDNRIEVIKQYTIDTYISLL